MTSKRNLKHTLVLPAVVAAILLLVAGTCTALAVTLTATTDLNGGTAIPTDAGSFNDTNDIDPYVYYIDSDPIDSNQQTRVAFDMGAFNLNNTGPQTEDVTIYASSLSHGTGGSFNFANSAREWSPDLTIDVAGALAARSVSTHKPGGRGGGGAVTLIASNGIRLVGGIDTRASSGGAGNRGGAVMLTSDGSTGSIQIGGDILTGSPSESGGTVTLTAANGINLLAGISTAWPNKTNSCAAIRLNGGTGTVSVASLIIAGPGGNGNLSITTTNNIILDTLDMSVVDQVSLLASSVGIDKLLNVSGYISGKNFMGFWDVSSDVFYNPDNSQVDLGGLSYTIVEGNGDAGGFKLRSSRPFGTVLIIR